MIFFINSEKNITYISTC